MVVTCHMPAIKELFSIMVGRFRFRVLKNRLLLLMVDRNPALRVEQ